MIVCPYHPEVVIDDVAEAFYCVECLDCRLLTSLYPSVDFRFFESEDEDK